MSLIYADFDEIVFENRGKDYGAYQMRRNYKRHLGRAALLAILLFTAGTAIPKIIWWFLPPPEMASKDSLKIDVIEMAAPPALNKEEEPPPPPPVPEPPKIETIKFVVPVPDENVKDTTTIKEAEDIKKDDNLGKEDIQGEKDPDWEHLEEDKGVGEVEEEKDYKYDEYVDLQEEPKPVNMDKFKELVGYPEMAKAGEIQGKVVVRVQVDKFGNYVQHKVIKDPHPILTKAVEAKLPQLKFTPGIQAGKPVKVWVTIPVDFKLNN